MGRTEDVISPQSNGKMEKKRTVTQARKILRTLNLQHDNPNDIVRALELEPALASLLAPTLLLPDRGLRSGDRRSGLRGWG